MQLELIFQAQFLFHEKSVLHGQTMNVRIRLESKIRLLISLHWSFYNMLALKRRCIQMQKYIIIYYEVCHGILHRISAYLHYSMPSINCDKTFNYRDCADLTAQKCNIALKRLTLSWYLIVHIKWKERKSFYPFHFCNCWIIVEFINLF